MQEYSQYALDAAQSVDANIHWLAPRWSPCAFPFLKRVCAPHPQLVAELYVILHEIGHMGQRKSNCMLDELLAWQWAIDYAIKDWPLDDQVRSTIAFGMSSYIDDKEWAKLNSEEKKLYLLLSTHESPMPTSPYHDWEWYELATVELAPINTKAAKLYYSLANLYQKKQDGKPRLIMDFEDSHS